MTDISIVSTSRPKILETISSKQMDGSLKLLESDVAASIINETCPKCEYKQMRFQTLQMRSADEGATVFYEYTGFLLMDEEEDDEDDEGEEKYEEKGCGEG
ncbi:hypothetical protein T552_03015 [Pneumocystis carinii B80]|uniref:TFIIS-type domain-containing protein n=1 Tax=Pneumocystis carinii (strain B80) TaxID=1408658 RepID=A0A0W4ZCP1_PNEC8|nr:hypothetical protein T552_03015 [Pneumocystis carinii B80]KTW26121.1 hypothetical protein T552_03015 [Pneumocystis carinii B80]